MMNMTMISENGSLVFVKPGDLVKFHAPEDPDLYSGVIGVIVRKVAPHYFVVTFTDGTTVYAMEDDLEKISVENDE